MKEEGTQKSVTYLKYKVNQAERMKIIDFYNEKLSDSEKQLHFYIELPPLNKKERLLYTMKNKKMFLVSIILIPILLCIGLFIMTTSIFAMNFFTVCFVGTVCIGFGLALLAAVIDNYAEVFSDEFLLRKLNRLLEEIEWYTKDSEKSKTKLKEINKELSNYENEEETKK